MKINKIYKIVFVLAIVALVSSCQEDWDFSYPYIKTVSVNNSNDTSAVFTGEIIKLGNDEIQEYGYVIDYYGLHYIKCENSKNEEGSFEIILSSILRKGNYIKIAAYAKTNSNMVVGDLISYRCVENVLPEIISITPISGDVNTVRTMVVKNYQEIYSHYTYFLIGGSRYRADITKIGPNTFEIKLISSLPAGSYKVSLYNYGLAEYSEELVVTD